MSSSRTRTTSSWARRATSSLAALLLAACGTKAPPEPVGFSRVEISEPLPDAPIDFVFDSLDARSVSSRASRGKVTVVAFVTTYDLGSQAQVNYLVAMAKHDGERVNYMLVALEAKSERELVEVYRKNLGVTFPVALADDTTIAGGGPFGDVHRIPTVVVLDPTGKIVFKKTGLSKADEIRAAMRGM